MLCNFIQNKTAKLKVKISDQTTFWLTPISFSAPQIALKYGEIMYNMYLHGIPIETNI